MSIYDETVQLFGMHGAVVIEGWDWQDRKALKHLNFDAMIMTHVKQPDASKSKSQKAIA